ncbi:hypothetical protein D3C78_1965010 [compost metagenome]
MPAALLHMSERGNFLGVQTKAVFFQGHVQALYPSHFAKAQGQFRIVGMIDLNAVAAFLLGHVAGHVGSAQ